MRGGGGRPGRRPLASAKSAAAAMAPRLREASESLVVHATPSGGASQRRWPAARAAAAAGLETVQRRSGRAPRRGGYPDSLARAPPPGVSPFPRGKRTACACGGKPSVPCGTARRGVTRGTSSAGRAEAARVRARPRRDAVKTSATPRTSGTATRASAASRSARASRARPASRTPRRTSSSTARPPAPAADRRSAPGARPRRRRRARTAGTPRRRSRPCCCGRTAWCSNSRVANQRAQRKLAKRSSKIAAQHDIAVVRNRQGLGCSGYFEV